MSFVIYYLDLCFLLLFEELSKRNRSWHDYTGSSTTPEADDAPPVKDCFSSQIKTEMISNMRTVKARMKGHALFRE